MHRCGIFFGRTLGRQPGLANPVVKSFLVAANPGIGMAFDIALRVLALSHACVLGADVAHRQDHQFKQFAGRRILLNKLAVGDNPLGIGYEAIIFSIRQLGIQMRLRTRQ